MSRTYETRTRPARDYRVCTGRRCDLCGRETSGDEWGPKHLYEVNETSVSVTVRQRHGHRYPGEDGDGMGFEVDLCPDCFEGRLVPWLRSQGAAIEQTSWGRDEDHEDPDD